MCIFDCVSETVCVFDCVFETVSVFGCVSGTVCVSLAASAAVFRGSACLCSCVYVNEMSFFHGVYQFNSLDKYCCRILNMINVFVYVKLNTYKVGPTVCTHKHAYP